MAVLHVTIDYQLIHLATNEMLHIEKMPYSSETLAPEFMRSDKLFKEYYIYEEKHIHLIPQLHFEPDMNDRNPQTHKYSLYHLVEKNSPISLRSLKCVVAHILVDIEH